MDKKGDTAPLMISFTGNQLQLLLHSLCPDHTYRLVIFRWHEKITANKWDRGDDAQQQSFCPICDHKSR